MKRINPAGFTLIELLIALFVLTVVLLGISTMVYSVMQSTSLSKETSTATMLMQDKMEGLKHTALAALASGNDSVRLGNLDYLRQWTVTAASNVRTIAVTVSWTNRGARSVTMTTLRGD